MNEEMDVDGILAGIESPSSSVPMNSEPMAQAPAQASPDPKAQTPREYEFKWNGKQIKAPEDRMLQWASQGYDYSQKAENLKAMQAEFENTRHQCEPKLQRYSEVDEYAAKNPEWWDHVNKSWQERQQALDPSNPVAGEIQTIKSELAELKKFRSELVQEKTAAQQKAEDDQLDSEIAAMRTQHKDLDWASVDETGFSLESRILKHATDNGISSFRAAFRDYNHEKLIEMAAMQAKESAVKERQKAVKAGLMGYSSTPRNGLQATDVKGKSYNQLIQEAMTELGIK